MENTPQYDFLFFCATQKIFLDLFPMTSNTWTKSTMEVKVEPKLFGYKHFSKYILLCSAEEDKKSYRFGTS